MTVSLLDSPELGRANSLMFLATRCLEQRLIFLNVSLISITRECNTVRRIVGRIQILHGVVEHVHFLRHILQKLLRVLTFLQLLVLSEIVEGGTHIL